MECKNCINRVVAHAFSTYKCEICKIDDMSANTPPDKLCDDCSEKNGLCKHCGKKIEE